MNTSTIVQKLWNYCNGPGLVRSFAGSPAREHTGVHEKPRLTLRDDGMWYGDYPLASLRAGFVQPALTPALSQRERGCCCFGDELFDHYRHPLEALGNQKGLLKLVFNKSQNNCDPRRFLAALTLRAPWRALNLWWRWSGSAAKLLRHVFLGAFSA